MLGYFFETQCSSISSSSSINSSTAEAKAAAISAKVSIVSVGLLNFAVNEFLLILLQFKVTDIMP